MSQQDRYNVTENEFIKGIADGKYTPNDAVAYCRGCFDKIDFLDNLYVSSFASSVTEREYSFLCQAKERVYQYLIEQGYELKHNYGCWGYEADKARLTNYFTISQDEQEKNVMELLVDYPELATERAIKYIARAISVRQKYIFYRLDGTGLEWRFGGEKGKARLAYFLEKVYCPEPTNTINAEQYRQLERLFKKTRLDRTISQNADTGKTRAVQNWRAEIDREIFFD